MKKTIIAAGFDADEQDADPDSLFFDSLPRKPRIRKKTPFGASHFFRGATEPESPCAQRPAMPVRR